MQIYGSIIGFVFQPHLFQVTAVVGCSESIPDLSCCENLFCNETVSVS